MEKLKRYKCYEDSVLMKKLTFNNLKVRRTFVLNIGLSKTNHTYFSFTIKVYNGSGKIIERGADHELMEKIFPEIKKYIDLHLSDISGTPMYALENGYYYLQKPQEFDTKVVAEHFRIPMQDAKKLQKLTKSGQFTKEDCAEYVEKQKPRWKKEAQACINWIKSLDDTTVYNTNINY